MKVKKRDGSIVEYDKDKIAKAVFKAFFASNEIMDIVGATNKVTDHVDSLLVYNYEEIPVEGIQDYVIFALHKFNYPKTEHAYITYRQNRADIRNFGQSLLNTFDELVGYEAAEIDLKRENANINADTAMGNMLKYGTEGIKQYLRYKVLPKHIAHAHFDGFIHIHDLDFYLLTLTCIQIDLLKLFKNGFNTGHGSIREPSNIRTAANLCCIAIQSSQNDFHGGQSIPAFDFFMAPYVTKTFAKHLKERLETCFRDTERSDLMSQLDFITEHILETLEQPEEKQSVLGKLLLNSFNYLIDDACKKTEADTYQAMEALLHNLCTMQSRAGSQTPFSSLNYGTDTSWQGRMVVKQLLLATQAGLGSGETPIFPVQIFKVKEGINYNPEDPSYDLFKLAIATSAKRLFPNFSFLDAPFNKQYYKAGDYNSEVAYMGCVQKDQVITYLIRDMLYVESIERAFNRLAYFNRIKAHGVSDYIDTEGLDIWVYDSDRHSYVEVKKVIRNPEPKQWKLIKCSNGRSIVLTLNHPLPVKDKGRVLVKDLQVGDTLVGVWDQDSNTDIVFNNDLAWLYGVMLCDGQYANNIVISVGLDESDIVDKVITVCNKYDYDYNVTKQDRGEKGSYFDISIKSEKLKYLRSRLNHLFGGEKKANRHIPTEVFSWNTSAKFAFLAGMFDADGHVNIIHDTTYSLSIGSTNQELAIQQMLLFQALDLPAKIYRNHYKNVNAGAIAYRVYANPTQEFLDEFLPHLACGKKIKKMQELKPSQTKDLEVKIEEINNYVDHNYCYDLETSSGKFDVSGFNSYNCRTRVIGNVYDPTQEVTCGRGNISFTSINLPRIAIESQKDVDTFYQLLDQYFDLVVEQLNHRLKIQGRLKVKNFPFMMGEHEWLDSEKLTWDDSVYEVIKHGTLSIGFVGLAECLKMLTGCHHGESELSQKIGLEIVSHLRNLCDIQSSHDLLNYTLLATPAESLAGRFLRLDREKYGIIQGVTDREYYTNSFHVPVYYKIRADKKIDIEAPYHAFTNAGHITYVELDGDVSKNLQAFERIIRHMHDKGVGYGSVNHPVDRDPICGYTGIIGDVCPRCGRHEGEALSQEQIIELANKYHDVPKSTLAMIGR